MALALTGCDGETVAPTDGGPGGTDAGPGGGVDAGPGGGADSGPGGGTDSGPGGEPDAGPMEPVDAGPPTCEMGRISIQEECPAFTPCGGDPVGMWCYAEICATRNELLDQLFNQEGVPIPQQCRDVRDEIVVRRSSGTVSGTMTVTAANITRQLTTAATGTFYLPMECVISNCRATAGAIDGALGDNGSAVCRDETAPSEGCECDITFLSNVDEDVAYSLDGDTIVTDGGRRFDYCADGAGLSFKQDPTDGSSVIEPGVQSLLPVSG